MNKFRRRSSSPLFFGERGGACVTSMRPGTCVVCWQCPPPGVTQNSVDVTHYTHCRHRSVRTTFRAVANQALSAGAPRRPGEGKSTTRPPAERRPKTVLFFPRWPQKKKRPRENLLATAAPALTAAVTGTAPSVERGMRRSAWLTASPTRREPGSAGTRRTVPTAAVLCAFLKLAPLCRQQEDTSEDGAFVDRLLSSSRVMCIRPDMSPCPIGPAMVRPHWPSMPSGWRKVRNVVHWSPFVQTYRKYKYPWIQLAGHQGNFRSGAQGTILKKLCGKEESCLKQLMRDPWLRDYVPEFKGRVEMEDCSSYLELQDLLAGFQCPCVMDVKIGLRTYLEEELAKAREKPKLRKDMYEKMVAVDPDEPTPEEHELKAVTKPRYMIWRETISSTASLGFRIEGIKNPDGTSTKDFKTTKSREQVLNAIDTFTKGFDDALGKYLQRLRSLYNSLEQSEFFSTHEFIGSSLLFVHDRAGASVWLIDFAKTVSVPPGVNITHRQPWEVGNHEDGYLIGLSNLIGIFEELLENRCGGYSKSLPPEITA